MLRMLGQYEERYSGLTVKHLHDRLQQRHSYKLGYTATRHSLQSTGLSNRPKRSARRGACCSATSIPTGAALGYTLSSARRISSIRKGLIKIHHRWELAQIGENRKALLHQVALFLV
jgi:hypothetical protein